MIFICFCLIYILRLHASQPLNIPDQAAIRLTGRIIQQPYQRDSKQIINVNGFLIKADRFPAYFYGQKVVVTGKVQKRMINRFASQFSLYYPQIQVIDQTRTLIDKINFGDLLFGFRKRLEEGLGQALPEPQVSLLAGILLGSRRDLPEKFMTNLRGTGTMHVIVASGYNISVVAGFLVGILLLFFRRRSAVGGAFLGIVGYTIMAGGEPPVVRAAIMGSLTCLAQLLGREKDVLASLLFAAAIMLLVSPLILFDIGFQLSFLATAGILLIEPLLTGKLFSLPLLGQDLKVTLAAQIATLPILVFNFGQISLLSLLVNALVLPVTPLIMGLGAVTAGLSLVSVALARVSAWLVWLPLTYFVKVIDWFGPWSQLVSLKLASVSNWWVGGYYLGLSLWLWRQKRVSASSA